jgi:hypothetical protein
VIESWNMCVNTVADSVILYLKNYFCNTIFKTKHKLCVTSGSLPQGKILGAHLLCEYAKCLFQKEEATACAFFQQISK